MTDAIVVQQEGRSPLYLLLENSVEIGRECDGLVVADERVSRRHLRIESIGGRVTVTDLGSSNGTFVDGVQLGANQPMVLGVESSVMFGSTRIRLHQLQPAVEVNSRSTVVGRGTEDGSGEVVKPDPIDNTVRLTSIETMATAMSFETPQALAQAIGQDETVTIMFSDIESSTELALSMGDSAWMAVLREHNTIFERRVAQYGGTIIKNQGDGYMLTFGSARRAVLCAAHVQQDLETRAQMHPEGAIRVRMGCHTGEAIHESGDLFGKHVIIAARVAGLADGAQVYVSSLVKEITSARTDLIYGPPQSVELKGVDGLQQIYELDWAAAPVNDGV